MNETVRYGACNLCEAICGLEYRLENGRLVSVRGDAEDPLSRGHICPKAVALQDVYEDPDRLRQPMKRIGERWEAVSWEQALDEVAERLADVHARHGGNSIAGYLGNPSVHNWGVLTHSQWLFAPLKTRNRYSATSVDQLPHQLVAYWMYGHQLLLPVPDIDRSHFILMLGANPMASNGSLWTVPDFRKRLRDLQARGGRLVVIDPRRTETAAVADQHHFIRPGTDAALLLALLQVLLHENRARPGRLHSFTEGLDQVREAVAAYTPERVAGVTGIAADDIRALAEALATAPAAAVYGRIGLSTQAFGTVCQWAIQVLNIVTGNLDREGGMMFTQPAVDLIHGPSSKPGHYNAWRSRVRGLPEFGGELPVAALAEEILTPGEGQVRALITIAGNPVLSTPNGRQLDGALGQLEFMVAVDCYVNETTRHAHYILPPTHALEHDHYDLIFHHLAVRNTARYNPALFPKPAGALHDWEIFVQLGRRLQRRLQPRNRRPWPQRLALRLKDEVMMRLPPHRLLDIGLRSGPHGHGSDAALSLKRLAQAPHGIDLGPLRPLLPQRLVHRSKRIDAAPPLILADLPRLEAELFSTAQAGDAHLWLVGRRHLRSNNSWMHNAARLTKGKPRHQLYMHPQDMQARGIVDGERVRVRSRVGAIEVEVQATEAIMPSVVSLPHGWGHRRPGVQLRVAQQQPGESINDLTDDQAVDALSGNAAFNGIAVSVERIIPQASRPQTSESVA